MKTNYISFFMILLLCNLILYKNSFAQNLRFYGAIEAGFNKSIAGLKGSSDALYVSNMLSPFAIGGNIGLEYKKRVFAEIGTYYNTLGRLDWSLKNYKGGGISYSNRQLEPFIRFGYNLNLKKEKWLLSPVTGIHLGFNNKPDSWFNYESDTTNSVNFYKWSQNLGLKQNYFLIETSLQLSYLHNNKIKFSILGRYNFGLTKIWESRYEYRFSDGTSGNVTIWQKGGYWLTGISIGYFFNKEDFKMDVATVF